MAIQQLNLFGEPIHVTEQASPPEVTRVLRVPENIYKSEEIVAEPVSTADEAGAFIIDEKSATAENKTGETQIFIPDEAPLKTDDISAIAANNADENPAFIVEEEINEPETTVAIAEIPPAKQKKGYSYKSPLTFNEAAQQKKRGRKSYAEMDAEAEFVMMPPDEEIKKKLYHSITDVAQWFNVNPSLLRYWENEFTILSPRKTGKGDRLYNAADIKTIQIIYYLLRTRKFSIEGAKKYVRSNRKDVDASLQVMETLNRFKGFLQLLKSNL